MSIIERAADVAAKAAPPKIDKTKRLAHRKTGQYYHWYIITGVTFGCMVVYACSLIRSWYLRRRARNNASPRRSNVISAFRAGLNNMAFNQPIPLSIYSRSTPAEWFFTIAYIALTLGLGFRASRFQHTWDYANPMGMVAFAQMPFIVGLAGRNNALSYLTGISYEKFNYLHRAAGRVCVLTTALHTFGWVKKGLGKHGPGHEVFTTGVVAAVALLVMFLTSFKFIRARLWEAFMVFHVVFGLMFITAAWAHWPPFKNWIFPCIILWGFDRLCGVLRLIVLNKWWSLPLRRSKKLPEHTAVIELVDPNVVRIAFNRPLLKWSPGQHVYLTMPEVATLRYEQHPFTLASCPDDTGNAVCIVRAQTGFTRRIVESISAGTATFRTYVEGPYGMSPDMNHYDSVVLIAGGTGITFALSHFLQIVKNVRAGKSAVKSLRLVWNIRQAENVSWIAPLVNAALSTAIPGLSVRLDAYVTRSAVGGGSDADSPTTLTPTASDEDISEKTKETSGLAALAGLNGAAAAITTFHQGRSDIEHILRHEVASPAATGPAGGLGVAVCGPTTLAVDARRAVCKVNTMSAVMKGQPEIGFYSGNFGF